MQASRENGALPLVGHLRRPPEGIFRTPCVSRAQIRRASEMTPDGWCTVISAGLHPLGDQSGTPFSLEISKIAKKCPK